METPPIPGFVSLNGGIYQSVEAVLHQSQQFEIWRVYRWHVELIAISRVMAELAVSW
jgi:hypothetical protein